MPNLMFTQAQWSSLFRMIAVWGRAINILRAQWRFYRDRRTQIIEEFEQGLKLSSWVLNGVIIGTNTAENGELYVNLTIVGPNATVDVYENSAKGALDRVATGVVAFPGTITLAQDNASGMSGSVVVAAAPANDTDIVLNVQQDLNLLITNTFPATNIDDDKSATVFKTYISATLEGNARTELTGLIDQFTTALTTWLKKRTTAPNSVSDKGVVTYTPENVAGAVTIDLEEGMGPWLVDAMDDETVAGAQSVKASVVTLGSLVSDADNLGQIALSSTSTRQHAQSGTIRLTCVDETVGSEQFAIEHILTEPWHDGTEIYVPEFGNATIKQSYTDGKLGVTFTASRVAVTESGDDGNMMSTYVVVGETNANTDFGVIYFKVTRNIGAPIWTIEAFQDQAFGTLIGSVTADGIVGVVPLQILGLGLTINFNFDKAAANVKLPAAGNQDLDIKIDLETSRLGDSHLFTVTNDQAGNFQSVWGYVYHHPLKSSGAPTINDGMMKSLPLTLSSSDEP